MKDTVVINTWSDLEVFGIKVLTGEACAYSMRMLCDVNEEGLELLEEFFGALSLSLPENMNSQVNQKPAIHSVMLLRGLFNDLAVFAAWKTGACAVYKAADNTLIALYNANYAKKYQEQGFELQWNPTAGSALPMFGSRVQHAATGRYI